MLQRLIDDVRNATGDALRLTSVLALAAIAALITIIFLCAAAFVYVLQTYGAVQACLAAAAIFLVLTIVAVIWYAVRKRAMEREAKARAEQAARAARQSLLTDPMLIAAGLQIVRAIGVKRLIPILAIAGVALGIMASRAAASGSADDEPAKK